MKYTSVPKLVFLLLVLGLAFPLSVRSSMSQPSPSKLATGDFDPVSVGSAAPGTVAITAPSAPAFGALVYTDFAQLEAQARASLKRGLEARLALSPYQGNIEFSQYVTKFDYEAGWTRDYTGTTPYTQTLTLMGLIDRADQDLRAARNLYGYLAVYAPEYRFRADSAYITTTLPGYLAPLCGATNKEDPDPADPAHSGLVLDPVMDWCNFAARMRQSAREAAYLRMIFGQQFMADALGLQFSGTTLLGAENAVRQETARLRAAKYQYELAERGLNEALDLNLGSGCYVSDFFTQSEWSLLSRAMEGQETAQHHLAVRLSYLDVPQQPDGPQQTRNAGVEALRAASMNGYIKLIGLAGLSVGQPTGTSCAKGVRPDGALAAEMAINLAETRRKSHEMADGRNVFGFDVTFTPARRYTGGVCGSETAGLYQDALCAVGVAQGLQNDEAAATREYNDAQDKLQTEVQTIQSGIDTQITAKSGCKPADWACVDQQIAELNRCLTLVASTTLSTTLESDPFSVCLNGAAIKNSDAKRALFDLRSVWVQQHSITTQAENISKRIQLSKDRNATVKKWLIARGVVQTVADAAAATLDMISCLEVPSIDPVQAAGAVVKDAACGIAGALNIALQAAAGGVSTAADVEIEDADSHKEVENMLLDQSELLIDAYGAAQQYASKFSEYTDLLSSLKDDVLEAQRQRAYFQHSPANDPSFRIVRDSTRLKFANQLAYATRMAYLAARRAEYEYAARLNVSNVRFSDVYRARTAADLTTFLDTLGRTTNSLAGSASYQTDAEDLTYSVALHWLKLTDEALAKEGFTTPAAAQAERTRRFRAWVAANTVPNDFESPYDNKPVLKFNFATSLLDGGTFARLIQQGYDGYWLIKLSGVAEPKPGSNGLSVNLKTDQAGLSYRKVRETQGGQVHLRSQAGCIFDYRLVAPSVLLGQEWAANQSAEASTATFNANVNQAHAYTENDFRTSAFLGRGASATDWQVLIFAGAPAQGLSDMDLQQLTDIELNLSITHASRTPGTPGPTDCTRIDW
jgi:hypothetical protein